MKMEIAMRVITSIIKDMDKEQCNTQMERNTKDLMKMVRNMDKEKGKSVKRSPFFHRLSLDLSARRVQRRASASLVRRAGAAGLRHDLVPGGRWRPSSCGRGERRL